MALGRVLLWSSASMLRRKTGLDHPRAAAGLIARRGGDIVMAMLRLWLAGPSGGAT